MNFEEKDIALSIDGMGIVFFFTGDEQGYSGGNELFK